MNKIFQIPPKSPKSISSVDKILEYFKPLIGSSVPFTGKPRTDGSAIRKIISNTLLSSGLPEEAETESFEIVPPKKKGVPRLLREMIDTYIVTTGDTYNLQVWNRFPNSHSILVKYYNGEVIRSKNIRLVFVKLNIEKKIIDSIVILTPDYIENKFGKFGKPTIKHQLLISPKQRSEIIKREKSILSFPDTSNLSYRV